jgi:hypothetical protein
MFTSQGSESQHVCEQESLRVNKAWSLVQSGNLSVHICAIRQRGSTIQTIRHLAHIASFQSPQKVANRAVGDDLSPAKSTHILPGTFVTIEGRLQNAGGIRLSSDSEAQQSVWVWPTAY